MIYSALSIVDVSEESLETVVVADEKEFGPTIHQLQKEAGSAPDYTDNNTHKAVAKTIPRRQGDHITSSIVMRDMVVAEVAPDAMRTNNVAEWGPDSQFYIYIFTHEVGHCKDNVLRPDHEEIPLQISGRFTIQQVARYYFPIVLSEFAACVHSAGAMSEAIHRRQISGWQRDVKDSLVRIKKCVLEYRRDNSKLQDLGYESAQSFWFIIVQYAKIIGSIIGNPGLDPTAPAWITPSPEIEELLSKIDAGLEKIWGEYPAVSDTAAEKFLAIWKALALANGYRFEEGEYDGLYLD
jgi:hypothetical protein